ncbi:uncharacterized protein TNCV_1415841 [Trichonephila clavipes]|nr:uncharacterized protein TNCV_1415841 [Trichonephila clavipes]
MASGHSLTQVNLSVQGGTPGGSHSGAKQNSSPQFRVLSSFRGHLTGRALDWFDVLRYRVVEEKETDYAQLKQALTKQFPVVRKRSEFETRFYASYQNPNRKPSNFVYELLKIHKQLKLDMVEQKLLDHVISRLEPQLLDYVEVRHPQTTSSFLQIIDKYEERFLNRNTRGSSQTFRIPKHSANNQFPNKNRQEHWRNTRVNNRYSDNSRPQRQSNRFGGQCVGDNQSFDSRRRSGQSDHRFNNQDGRQSGSRNGDFRGQNGQDRRFQRVPNSPTWSPMTPKWSSVTKLAANLVPKNDANLVLPPSFPQVLIESPL